MIVSLSLHFESMSTWNLQFRAMLHYALRRFSLKTQPARDPLRTNGRGLCKEIHLVKMLTTASMFLLGLLSVPALANEAHICRSQAIPQSHKNATLSDDTSFVCGSTISGTIPTLAAAGWQISQVIEQADTTALSSLKPGQLPPDTEELTKTYWMILIQK